MLPRETFFIHGYSELRGNAAKTATGFFMLIVNDTQICKAEAIMAYRRGMKLVIIPQDENKQVQV